MLHRKAHQAPNSSALPKRRVGFSRRLSSSSASMLLPALAAAPAAVPRRRSVSKGPGIRLLSVTFLDASLGCRAKPAMKPVNPDRAPLLKPRVSIGAFTAADVMLTTRPKPRAAMPSTVDLISSMGVSMLASSALIHASRSQSRKSPGGGPPALLTRMSTCGQAASAAARPPTVVMSPATATTCTPGASERSSAAVACSASSPRAVMTTLTPSCTSARAQPLPRPLLAAQTRAHLPLMPRSMTIPFQWVN